MEKWTSKINIESYDKRELRTFISEMCSDLDARVLELENVLDVRRKELLEFLEDIVAIGMDVHKGREYLSSENRVAMNYSMEACLCFAESFSCSMSFTNDVKNRIENFKKDFESAIEVYIKEVINFYFEKSIEVKGGSLIVEDIVKHYKAKIRILIKRSYDILKNWNEKKMAVIETVVLEF